MLPSPEWPRLLRPHWLRRSHRPNRADPNVGAIWSTPLPPTRMAASPTCRWWDPRAASAKPPGSSLKRREWQKATNLSRWPSASLTPPPSPSRSILSRFTAHSPVSRAFANRAGSTTASQRPPRHPRSPRSPRRPIPIRRLAVRRRGAPAPTVRRSIPRQRGGQSSARSMQSSRTRRPCHRHLRDWCTKAGRSAPRSLRRRLRGNAGSLAGQRINRPRRELHQAPDPRRGRSRGWQVPPNRRPRQGFRRKRRSPFARRQSQRPRWATRRNSRSSRPRQQAERRPSSRDQPGRPCLRRSGISDASPIRRRRHPRLPRRRPLARLKARLPRPPRQRQRHRRLRSSRVRSPRDRRRRTRPPRRCRWPQRWHRSRSPDRQKELPLTEVRKAPLSHPSPRGRPKPGFSELRRLRLRALRYRRRRTRPPRRCRWPQRWHRSRSPDRQKELPLTEVRKAPRSHPSPRGRPKPRLSGLWSLLPRALRYRRRRT